MNLDLLNIRLSYQYGIIEFDQYREMMASVRESQSVADLLGGADRRDDSNSVSDLSGAGDVSDG